MGQWHGYIPHIWFKCQSCSLKGSAIFAALTSTLASLTLPYYTSSDFVAMVASLQLAAGTPPHGRLSVRTNASGSFTGTRWQLFDGENEVK